MSFLCKIMEQCWLCPAKLWSNADFALQNHRAFVLCPIKSQRLCSLPRKIIEQCRLYSAKSWRHSFRGKKYPQIWFSSLFIYFFCCKSLLFQTSLQPFGPLVRGKMFRKKRFSYEPKRSNNLWPPTKSTKCHLGVCKLSPLSHSGDNIQILRWHFVDPYVSLCRPLGGLGRQILYKWIF